MKYTIEHEHKRPTGRDKKTWEYRKRNAKHEIDGNPDTSRSAYNRAREKEKIKNEINNIDA